MAVARDRERLEALKKALKDDPRSLVFVSLAEEHSRLGEYEQAAKVAKKGLLSHPDSVAGRLALAVAEAERDKIGEAVEQIKRALMIDQDNPKALALMGRILLKKGLAKRAVQFLSHAVKLDPKAREYHELLKQARKLAKGGKSDSEVPVFDGNQVPTTESPWTYDDDEEPEATADAEHTVFDPDALKKLRSKKKSAGQKLDNALADLPSVGDEDPNEEPTKFVGQAKRKGSKEGADPREEPTAFGTPNPLSSKGGQGKSRGASLKSPPVPKLGKSKAKMGGSAAEFSQMMRQADADRAIAELKKRGPAPAPETDDLRIGEGPTTKAPSKPRPLPKAPSLKMEMPSEEQLAGKDKKAAEKKPEAKKAEPKPAEAKKAEAKKAEAKKPAEKKPEPEAKKPAPNKKIGPIATMMVDDAMWDLFGSKNPVDAPPAEAPAEEAKAPAKADPKDPKKPAEKKKPAAAKAEAQAKPGPMVVRTSARFGTWTQRAVVFVLCVVALWVCYAMAGSKRGAAPEVATQEIKGIAGQLELGGLASLLAAEEALKELRDGNPDLNALLGGAMAEVHTRRWAKFGKDPEVLGKARAEMKLAQTVAPTVELLTAMVALSTTTQEREAIDKQLVATIKEFPKSPKTWVLRSRLAQLGKNDKVAGEALYQAFSINPQHRLTLLELARWHAHRGSHGSAFGYFDQLQEKYPLDVEAALDRYVLGQLTGEDPAESQTVSALAGLVRNELPEVAKDETGRAALAFAVPKLMKGEFQEGIEELSKAEPAYERSALFKGAVAGAFLTIGEFERAKKLYQRALELDPGNKGYRVGIARASLGERSGLKLKPETDKKRVKKWNEKSNGVARLPFGTIRFEFGRFELVRVEPDPSFFPERLYQKSTGKEGAELQKWLDSVSLLALAEQKIESKKYEKALELLTEANALYDSSDIQFALGRAYLGKKRLDKAIKLMRGAIKEDRNNIPGRLALARALVAKGQKVEAMEVLDAFGEGVVVPDAQFLLAKLRLERGDFEGAVKPLESVRSLYPSRVAPLIVLGEIKHRLKKRDEALTHFKEAIKMDPKILNLNRAAPSGLDKLSPVALLYLGQLDVERNNKRGIAILRTGLKAETAPDETNFFLGKALLQRRRTRREGKQKVEQYLKLVPDGEFREEAERLLRRR